METRGMKTWRSLAELEGDPALLARAAQEFPALARRREVMALMAASLALSGCDDPADARRALAPPVVQPPDIEPGGANRYASVLTGGGEGLGVVVTHRSGRPVKIDGNPNHPASLGATDIFAQSAILDFYDPLRGGSVTRHGTPLAWGALLAELSDLRSNFREDHGAGLRLLTGSVLSPTLARGLQAVLAAWPAARWHQWEGLPRDAVLQGAKLAYGRPVAVLPKLERTEVLLALDSDLFEHAPGHVRHARDFAARRNPVRSAQRLRVYAAEPTPSLLGARADHRHIAGPKEMHALLQGLAAAVLRGETPQGWIAPVAADLLAHRGRALVHAGPALPAEAHALVHAVNEALGGRGATFEVIDPPEQAPSLQGTDLRALADDMHAGKVQALVVIGTNPMFTAPAVVGFGEALQRVPFSLTVATMPDETAAATTWYVPLAHELETWGDARGFDGTAALAQPQALPLHGGRSALEMLGLLHGTGPVDARAALRETWQLDDSAWKDALRRGVLPGTAHPALDLPLRPEAAQAKLPEPESGNVLMIRPDPHLGDGRHAPNPWLQEAPRPLTKVCWDNPLLISPDFARRQRLVNGAEVRLTRGTAEVVAPVWIVPGQAAEVIVALTGEGRRVAGPVATGVGTDMHPLRDQAGPLTVQRTGQQREVASTDHHNVFAAEDTEVVRRLRRDSVPSHPAEPPAPPSLYPPRAEATTAPAPVQWGMSIDLNACVGCNACVIACQAENNIPVVGKEEVLAEREMYWLRIDRYYQGSAEAPAMLFQPMLCQHCERAPCEIVCPVIATMHDTEGLNVQIYNRCVGTRFCSNNCPYKVRRFNFGAYAEEEPRPAESRNPEVTVRGRGVMEKCTFCLQRIAAARIQADIEGRTPQDGEVVTACQAACPTRAFSFGNVADPHSEVSRHKASPLTYATLGHLHTSPRVTYEARVDDPNPAVRT